MFGTWTEALEEVYVTNPAGSVIYYTLEFQHPSIVDENGDVGAIRLVSDPGALLVDGTPPLNGVALTLEGGAPLDAGETVNFYSCGFTLALPGQRDGQIPQLQITLDNATRILAAPLKIVAQSGQQLKIIYREYLADNPGAPQFFIYGLSAISADPDLTKVTITATFFDFVNRNFPAKLYRLTDYPGLVP